MKESRFQQKLIKKLKELFPRIIVMKNDENYIQGIPDLTLLWYDHWALLETKQNYESSKRPNQEYYIHLADEMSFGRFINEENYEEILDELQKAFKSERPTCNSRSK